MDKITLLVNPVYYPGTCSVNLGGVCHKIPVSTNRMANKPSLRTVGTATVKLTVLTDIIIKDDII